MNASELIDQRIAELGDWRGKMIARVRELVRQAAPDIIEEWKWDTPIWTTANGNVLAVGAFKDHVKINFFYGALLEDHHLFNAGLEAKTSRGIDLFEKDTIDEEPLKNLIRSAVDLSNLQRIKAKATPASAKQKTNTRVQKTQKSKTSAKKVAPKQKSSSDLPKLAAPAQRALAAAGISSLKKLSRFSEAQVRELHGMGPSALKVLRQALSEQGLAFANKK